MIHLKKIEGNNKFDQYSSCNFQQWSIVVTIRTKFIHVVLYLIQYRTQVKCSNLKLCIYAMTFVQKEIHEECDSELLSFTQFVDHSKYLLHSNFNRLAWAAGSVRYQIFFSASLCSESTCHQEKSVLEKKTPRFFFFHNHG